LIAAANAFDAILGRSCAGFARHKVTEEEHQQKILELLRASIKKG
jgi:hypothetical protein